MSDTEIPKVERMTIEQEAREFVSLDAYDGYANDIAIAFRDRTPYGPPLERMLTAFHQHMLSKALPADHGQDPDAHIQDQDEYLKAKQERFKDSEWAKGGADHGEALLKAGEIGPAERMTSEKIMNWSKRDADSGVPDSAIMEAVALGMSSADDAGEDCMSWVQSCVSSIKGVSDLTDAERLPTLKLKPQEPSLTVEQVMEVVGKWLGPGDDRSFFDDDCESHNDLRECLTKAVKARAHGYGQEPPLQ